MPKAVRDALGLVEGDQVVFRVHLTGDPPRPGASSDRLARTSRRAARARPDRRRGRGRSRVVAELVRAIIGFPAVVVVDEPLLLRALEVYEVHRLDFAEAYLVASAEATGVGTIASFDRAVDRVTTVQRIEPP